MDASIEWLRATWLSVLFQNESGMAAMTARIIRYASPLVLAALIAWLAPNPGLAQEGGGGGNAPSQADLNAPTPKMADGRPDLSGRCGGGANFGGSEALKRFDEQGNYHNLRNDRKASPVNQERDAGMAQRFFANVPVYKPEFWDKVDYLDVNGNVEDSNFHCFPAGIPRMGPPNEISEDPERTHSTILDTPVGVRKDRAASRIARAARLRALRYGEVLPKSWRRRKALALRSFDGPRTS